MPKTILINKASELLEEWNLQLDCIILTKKAGERLTKMARKAITGERVVEVG